VGPTSSLLPLPSTRASMAGCTAAESNGREVLKTGKYGTLQNSAKTA